MFKRNVALATIGMILAAVFGVLSVTPEPITPNVVRLTWITQPDTTYINIRDVTFERVGLAQSATGGITNTVTISGTTGMVFQIQEYKLAGCCLELITFFNTAPVPNADFPTATPPVTPTQTVTPQPIETPIVTLTPRVYMGVINA